MKRIPFCVVDNVAAIPHQISVCILGVEYYTHKMLRSSIKHFLVYRVTGKHPSKIVANKAVLQGKNWSGWKKQE